MDINTVKTFKIRDFETGKEYSIEMSIKERLYLRMFEELIDAVRSNNK